jgi:aldehyde dehydrogenase (NAD+)
LGRGFFIPVTIFDNPPEDSRIVKEEQFGPVLPLLKVDNIDEAVVRANDSEYGLAASVWSANDEAALKVAEQLNAGTVWINQTLYLPPSAPFAGHKQSGIGVENGLDGLLEYTLTKTTTLKRQH